MVRPIHVLSIHALSCAVALALSGPVVGQEPAAPTATGPAIKKDYTLADFEALTMARSPVLVQAQAAIQAARGEAKQAGLYPNPILGYTIDGISSNPIDAQGGFIQQEIVVGGKLRLSRAVALQAVTQADWLAQAEVHRALNRVRIAYYDLVYWNGVFDVSRSEQKKASIAKERIDNQIKQRKTEKKETEELVERSRELGARIREAKAKAIGAERSMFVSWQRLVYFSGAEELSGATPVLAWDAATKLFRSPPKDLQKSAWLSQQLPTNPLLQAAHADAARAELAVKREKREPIPNVALTASSGYVYELGRPTVSLEVGVAAPLFNRNQGNISKARAEAIRSHAEAAKIDLLLRTTFEAVWSKYQEAHNFVSGIDDKHAEPAEDDERQEQLDYYLLLRKAEILLEGHLLPLEETEVALDDLLQQSERGAIRRPERGRSGPSSFRLGTSGFLR